MHKVKLELDRLSVESFETMAVKPGRGTVMANQYTLHGPNCDTSAADGCATGLCTLNC